MIGQIATEVFERVFPPLGNKECSTHTDHRRCATANVLQLSRLPRLRILEVRRLREALDIADLGKLTRLEKLELWRSRGIPNE